MTDSLSAIRHLIDGCDALPLGVATEIHRSASGDLWELVRDAPGDRCMVRHTPALSSGGQTSTISVEEFLAVACSGPEHEALRILMPNQGPAT